MTDKEFAQAFALALKEALVPAITEAINDALKKGNAGTTTKSLNEHSGTFPVVDPTYPAASCDSFF